MTKTKWGFVLVGGLALAIVGGIGVGAERGGGPSADFVNDLIQYAFIVLAVVGMVMFGLGAAKFSSSPRNVRVVKDGD